jgi:hypothetical protein
LNQSTYEQHEPSPPESEHRGLRLWLSWMAANSLVGIIFILPVLLIARLSDASFSGDNNIAPIGMCGLDLLVGSYIIAYCQSRVLNRWTIYPGHISWLRTSFLGFIAAIIALDFLNTVTSALVVAFVAGGVLGTIEWFVLRRYFRRAAWWIPANAVAWGVGVLLIQLTNAAFLPGLSTSHYNFPFRPTEAVIYWVGSFAVGVIIYGLVTGSMLLWFSQGSALNCRRS